MSKDMKDFEQFAKKVINKCFKEAPKFSKALGEL